MSIPSTARIPILVESLPVLVKITSSFDKTSYPYLTFFNNLPLSSKNVNFIESISLIEFSIIDTPIFAPVSILTIIDGTSVDPLGVNVNSIFSLL